jgi:hypothetical protein
MKTEIAISNITERAYAVNEVRSVIKEVPSPDMTLYKPSGHNNSFRFYKPRK